MRTRFSLLLAGAFICAAGPALAAGAATPESDAFSWTGLYVGVNAGYTWGHSVGTYENSTLAGMFGQTIMNPAGGFGGITLGGNQQLDNGLVVGIEGDVEYGDITDTIIDKSSSDYPNDTITGKTDWSGTLRGRVGFDAGKFLPYLTAGLAVANSNLNFTDGNVAVSTTLVGWTAGVGVEMALADKWSAKLEYLYTDLGTHTWFPDQIYASTSTSTSSTVRVGLNYGF